MTHSFPTRRASDRRCGVANGCACGPSTAWCCTWNPLRKPMEASHDHDRLRPGPAAAARTAGQRNKGAARIRARSGVPARPLLEGEGPGPRSEEHTSELQSLMRNSYDVFCLKKKSKLHIH